ncbi:protein FAM185A [Lepeophtheirus salmonis]|uniref:Protein FAM185Alike [Saccoglossus kowalevskii] n=1 Tax=Lepeophtheirus salmonis TaxID=72036 RepID=A0A0K2TC98_LEPSM|nr:protein FAM185A-like [Lepeophtheirus salmonis]XP_040579778.1 protein FAM185A-like [Lepeophtheirus salmonis]
MIRNLVKPSRCLQIRGFASESPTNKREKKTVLFEKRHDVPAFGGSLWLSSPTDVKVTSLAPHEYPNLDRAIIKVTGNNQELKDKAEFASKLEGKKLKFYCSTRLPIDSSEIQATVSIPVVHNVFADVESNGSLDVGDLMESDFCHLKGSDGDITVSRVKTNSLTVQSSGKGDIYCCGAIQGNIKITSGGSGSVACEKRFSGPSLDIVTDTGDISVAACYSETSKFSTNYGSMNLRNIHNESYIAVYNQGNVKIQGVDGSTNIFVKKGDIDCHISIVRHESRIHAEDGDIIVKVSDNFPLKISVNAVEVIPDINFSVHGKITPKDDGYVNYYATIHPDKFSPTLEIIAENGRVLLESQDWAASLGLKIPVNNNTHLG